MLSPIKQLQHQITTITKFLTPLLPLANCHMVEFLTDNHWDHLLPSPLREQLDGLQFDTAVNKFWNYATGDKDNTPLSNWIHTTRNHCVTFNDNYTITTEQLCAHIKSWHGDIKPEIRIKEFMSSKKSYEVQTMSSLVASLHSAVGSSCCVDAGGGRGPLPVALCLAYGAPSLTVDCDASAVATAEKRVAIIQKQWYSIAKRLKDGIEMQINESINKNLHRFATSFITKDTDLSKLVREKFPEFSSDNVKILLTGLHTCGNLGPDCLRIFTNQPTTAALFNVPCCYHLLSEHAEGHVFDAFQRQYGAGEGGRDVGFPMSEFLRGYQLGRNARMLAAQSIDRVVNERQTPPKSLLYRALLEATIKEYLPKHKISEGKLKRISSKCHDYQQYFKMADEILNLNLFDSLPDSYFTDLHKIEDCQWKKMVLFYLLRLCLAQVVESLILLDRLMFLFENGFEKVYLVKLFDPVMSPRCHGIVAVR